MTALCATPADFNPRSPWGERRKGQGTTTREFGISIHAPRGGSDIGTSFLFTMLLDFNPRSPWGERQSVQAL